MQISILKSILVSIISSILVVLAFYIFMPPKTIVIREEGTMADRKLIAQNNVLLSELNKNTSVNHFITAAEESRKSVVFIQVLQDKGSSFTNENYSASSGSGVIVSPDGYIVTNNHVINKADNIKVTLEDQRSFQAELIAVDEDTDLAILKIESQKLDYLKISKKDNLEVGEWVLAIGNPFNLESTVTAGIVSAKGRSINLFDKSKIENFIQTDAAVNTGSSGGALVNTAGQLVGINTAILTNTGKYEGFSFAVPAHIVNKVYNDILEFGAVQRGWMGVIAETVTDLDIKKFGLEDVSGIQLKSITRNSAADQAGLEKNDIILHINAERVTSVADFNGKLAMHRPGDVLQLKIYRNEQLINEKVTLLNHLNTTDFVAIRKDKILKQIGIEIRELSSEEKERTNKPKGIKVLSILQSSPAQLANMENNYIITAINGSDFKTAQNAVDLINKNKKRLQFDGFYEGYPGSYSYSIDLD